MIVNIFSFSNFGAGSLENEENLHRLIFRLQRHFQCKHRTPDLKVYTDISLFPQLTFPVVTAGTFDGVHLGHQKIIGRLQQIASENSGETVLITFDPHPRIVLFPEDNDLKLLNTKEEKINLLEQHGIDHLVVIPFTKEFSRLSSIEFVRNILVNRIGTKRLVIGYNHHFGRNREGSFEHLSEFGPVYGFQVEEIPAEEIHEVEVSSTKIRNALLSGDVVTASQFLGALYSISGKVVMGKQLGRTLGYPTANIEVQDRFKLIPALGIYAVKVHFQGKAFGGMMSIGTNPTVAGEKITLEVNIFDFNDDLYNKHITVSFIKKIRDEEKFPSLEILKAKMADDKQRTLSILSDKKN